MDVDSGHVHEDPLPVTPCLAILPRYSAAGANGDQIDA
jgi:hypothetical protein